ncbi:MAG TPA: hypothetical protein VGN22_20335 [Pseudonocardia sp.]
MTTSPHLGRTRTTGRGVLAAVAKRWPTVLGVALGVDIFIGAITQDTARSYAEMLLMLPLIYLLVAVLGRRRATWPVLAVLTALLVALRLLDRVEPFVVLLAVALAVAMWGSSHGRHRERDFRLQLAGMAGFGALALAGLAVDPDLARYLVAAGWLAHGVWDWVHLAKDRVVSRSFAEWCGALDVMIGAGLIIVPLL